MSMNPGPCVFVTVTFKETAPALAGMPQRPVSVKFRGDPWARAGGPYAPVKPLPRVSAMRQGVIAMNGRGFVSESAVIPLVRGGLQLAGADQFGIDCPDAMPVSNPTKIAPTTIALPFCCPLAISSTEAFGPWRLRLQPCPAPPASSKHESIPRAPLSPC